jgi:hypothetical protein
MAKPKNIRTQLSRYLCSVFWVQEWALQDPLKPQPRISNKDYPPNAAVELPIEQLQILNRSDFTNASEPNTLTCYAKFPFRISYVFPRSIYQTIKSIPINQLENLLFKATQLFTLYADTIDADIQEISIPQQQNPIILRPADDIRTDASNSADWVVIVKFDVDVTFLSSPSEFVHADWVDIQPSNFTLPDGSPIIDTNYQEFDLNGINIEFNRSELPFVRPDNPNTYVLDALLELRPDTQP